MATAKKKKKVTRYMSASERQMERIKKEAGGALKAVKLKKKKTKK